MRRLLALLLLLAGNANAQTVYKCVSGSGAVSWQSLPCAQGMRTMRSLAYTPEAPITLPASSHAPVKTVGRSHPKSGYHRVSARAQRPKPDACARARERRQATLERVGLKRNFDLLSKLDADVRSVCR
ncbi:hypothetical protein [Thermomonas sp.]|uniref:hypothetical protein n=1 Tax=Thermomonas sp. TaxID=1971895 RepID=UPI002487EE10|nr:hypothetical protein [Thermomonas sp.]MDI1253411.1 hypothetical protein [Thermomonas sp.]